MTIASSVIIGSILISLSILYSKKGVGERVKIWNWKFISVILVFFLIISAIDSNSLIFSLSFILLLITIIRIVSIKIFSSVAKRRFSKNEFNKQLIKSFFDKAKKPLSAKAGKILLKHDPFYSHYKIEFNFFAKSYNKSFFGDFENPNVCLNGDIVISGLMNSKYDWFTMRTKVYVVTIDEDLDKSKTEKERNRVFGSMLFESDALNTESSLLNEDDYLVGIHLFLTEKESSSIIEALEHNKLSNRLIF